MTCCLKMCLDQIGKMERLVDLRCNGRQGAIREYHTDLACTVFKASVWNSHLREI